MKPITNWLVAIPLLLVAPPGEATQCVDPEPPRVFADVPPEHPLCSEIESLYRDGLTAGCRVAEDGLRYFCPDEPATRAMAARFAEHRDPFARVDRDGRVRIGDHVVHTERYAKGIYWVQLTRDIQHCSMEAWTTDYSGPNVDVDINLLWGTVDTVVVVTTISGAPVDMWFNARLHCR